MRYIQFRVCAVVLHEFPIHGPILVGNKLATLAQKGFSWCGETYQRQAKYGLNISTRALHARAWEFLSFTVSFYGLQNLAEKPRNSAQRGANPTWLTYVASAMVRKPVKTHAKTLS